MGYGGILSGLVQGYGQAVIGNEKRQYEEKQERIGKTETANYNKVMRMPFRKATPPRLNGRKVNSTRFCTRAASSRKTILSSVFSMD